MTRLLVVGGSGFTGRAVASALARRPHVQVRWTTHRTPSPCRANDEIVHADLSDPATVRGLAGDCDAVIHLGHQITGTPTELAAVNDTGAGALADEATRAGARLVALSTAAVHGAGPWQGEDIHTLPEAPTSVLSRTRLAGDHRVLAAGGTVIRPHLVIGPGDRWVIPRAADLVAAFGWAVCGTARHSVITVADLADHLLDTATESPTGGGEHQGGVRLAAGADPTTLRSAIAAHLRATGRRPAPSAQRNVGHTRIAADPRRAHDIDLLSADHYLTCTCTSTARSTR